MKFRFDGLEFGGPTGPLMLASFEPGEAAIRSGDVDRSQGDGAIAGRDFLGKRTWGLTLTTIAGNLSAALAQESLLAGRWHDPKHRVDPLSLVPLS